MSDQWKVVFEFYISDMKWLAALYFWGVRLRVIQVPNDRNTQIVQSVPLIFASNDPFSKYVEDMRLHRQRQAH